MVNKRLTDIEKIFYETLAADICQDLKTGSLLDVGCGPGQLLFHIRKLRTDMKLTGIDIYSDITYQSNQQTRKEIKIPGYVEIGAKNSRVNIREGDASAIPFEDGNFDKVVSTSTLHHFPDNVLAFEEMYRVLKPGGNALVYDWRKEASYEEIHLTLEEWAANTMEPLRPGVLAEWIDEYWNRYVPCEQVINIAEKSSFESYRLEPFAIKQRFVLFKLTLEK